MASATSLFSCLNFSTRGQKGQSGTYQFGNAAGCEGNGLIHCYRNEKTIALRGMRKVLWALVASCLLAGGTTSVQSAGETVEELQLGTVCLLLTNVFHGHSAFTLVADCRAKQGGQTLVAQAGVARQGDKFKATLDVSKMGGDMVPPLLRNVMTSFGYNQLTHLVRLDRGLVWQVVLAQRAYCEERIDWRAALSRTNALRDVRIEQQPVGWENIDKQPCTRHRLMAWDGVSQPAHVGNLWRRRDGSRFPVQVQLKTVETAIQINFRNVNMVQVDSRLFNLPSGYKRYDSLEEMAFGGASGKAESSPPGPAGPSKRPKK